MPKPKKLQMPSFLEDFIARSPAVVDITYRVACKRKSLIYIHSSKIASNDRLLAEFFLTIRNMLHRKMQILRFGVDAQTGEATIVMLDGIGR
jgi:hypothetical protein